MARPSERRYSFAPLLAQMGNPSTEDASRHLGVNRVTIYRWGLNGVPESQADRAATQVLHLHPCNIWPEWLDVDHDQSELLDF